MLWDHIFLVVASNILDLTIIIVFLVILAEVHSVGTYCT